MQLYTIEKVERSSQRLVSFSGLGIAEFFTGIGNSALCQKISEDKFINWNSNIRNPNIRLSNLVGSGDEACKVRVGIKSIQWFVDD